jgi:Cu2+-exporting ATPase
MAHLHQQRASSPGRLTLPVTNLYCVCCAEELEARLRAEPHITRARVDFQSKTVDVEYHATMIDDAGIRALIDESGRCTCAGAGDEGGMTHLNHRVQMAPMATGGAHDKMQYEMPSTAAHSEHDAGHAKAMAHAGMDHDMSDPKMAKAMERDMRGRFFVALVLTIPTVLYSPLGSDFLHVNLPTGPFATSWIMLVLSTPVVWWGGWIFIAGAVRSLRHRSLNMSVLIATGVLAAWGFSVVITLGDLGETFFEAAAMLVTFVLLGHWMEMKSRRGTTDALRACTP